MNFLAHGWLARGGSDDFLYGNLIADGVKGVDLDAWGRAWRRASAIIGGSTPTSIAIRCCSRSRLGRPARGVAWPVSPWI